MEARYTLTMYEGLRALKEACEACRLGKDEVEAILYGNAWRLVGQHRFGGVAQM